MDHQLWIHSQDLDFMTAAIVLICSPPQSAPNNLRLLHLTLHSPTLTLHWLLRAFCLQLHCAQETEIQQNQLLCVGSQGRQGRMQAFHRHQSSMYNCQHCLTLPTLLYRCLKGESSAIWTQVDRGGHSPAHHLF